MNQFHRHDTCGVKYVQSMEAVSRPLNEGIVSICNICKSLSNAHVNPTTDRCSNYNKIRNHIEHAEQSLKTSETMIKEKLGYLDECMVRLIREKQNVQQNKKNKSLTMENVRIKMNSSKKSLKDSKAALEQAEKNVESAKDAIRIHQDSMSTYDNVATAGMVVLAIPILGWIAGPIMIIEGQKGSEAAFNAIRDAEWEKQSSDSEVRKWTAKVYYYENIISRTQNEIEQTNEALKKCEWELKEIQKHLEDTGNIQEMVRRAVTLLSVLSGRVTVLERQTQRFILWDPVVKAMEDVMKSVVTIAENQLLYSQGVPDFINALRENFGRLLALCNSPSNSQWKSYF